MALRPPFPFRQAQLVLVFPLKPASFCKLFVNLGTTNKSAISFLRLLLYPGHTVISSVFFPETLWLIWQELLSLSFTIRLQWVSEHSFLPGTTRLISWLGGVRCSYVLQSLAVSLLPLISTLLFSNWWCTVSSRFFDTLIPLISTEELMLSRHARCVLSSFRCKGRSFL